MRVRDLVPLAVMFRDLAGTSAAALSWTDSIAAHGAGAFSQLGLHGDITLLLADKARSAGIVTGDGTVDRVRLAELVVVLDIVGRVPPPARHSPAEAPLVFTVPKRARKFITPAQRLDLLVVDVIARAEGTLHIGGPFWNAAGWGQLRPVLLPAVATRGVEVHFYLHPQDIDHRTVALSMLTEVRSYGTVHEHWWAGGEASLMHAKFVVSDRTGGYFGTANLTSLGLGEHLELGVRLAGTQAHALVDLLDALDAASFFSDVPTGS